MSRMITVTLEALIAIALLASGYWCLSALYMTGMGLIIAGVLMLILIAYRNVNIKSSRK